MSGLPWSWENYGDYLNAVETLRPGINIAGLVGHSAVRYYVMGERSFAEQASDAEKAQMADIVAKALDAGAIGFSTNRLRRTRRLMAARSPARLPMPPNSSRSARRSRRETA